MIGVVRVLPLLAGSLCLGAQESRPAPAWLPQEAGILLRYSGSERTAELGWHAGTEFSPGRQLRSADTSVETSFAYGFAQQRDSIVCASLDWSSGPLGGERHCGTSQSVTILPLPPGITLRWEGPGYRAELLDPSVSIRVGAGTFTASRVRLEEGEDRVTIYWIARGIGLVKQDGFRGTWELTAVERSDAAPTGPLAELVTAAIANDPQIERGTATARELRFPELAPLPGRFVRVDAPRTSYVLHEKGGALTRFDPLVAAEWNALVPGGSNPSRGEEDRAGQIARAVAVLEGSANRGLARVVRTRKSRPADPEAGEVEATTLVTAQAAPLAVAGSARLLQATVVLRAGRVLDVMWR